MDIHVRLQVRPGNGELSNTGGMVYAQLVDSLTFNSFGLRYNHTVNAWEFFLSIGGIPVGAVVHVAQAFIDAYFGCNFHAIRQGNGTVVINIYHSTGYVGSLTTPGAWTFDSLIIGVLQNGSGEPVDHYFTAVTVGTTPGGNDLLAWSLNSLYSPPNGAQPFQTMAATGIAISTLIPTSEIRFFEAGSGDVDGYLRTQWLIQAPAGGDPLTDPGDASIILVGDHGWQMSGQPAWIIDHWGLDRLVISMRGSRRTRDSFLALLRPWMSWPSDQNMFLSNITQEQRGSSNFPQIDLTFVGKRGGILPPNKEQQGEQVQQISGRAIWNFSHTVNLTFIGTTSEQTVWSRTPIDLSTVNPLEPSAIELMWLVETDAIIWAGTWEAYLAIIETNVNECFVSRLVWTGVSEEVVPGQYYRATRTMQRLYFPVLG